MKMILQFNITEDSIFSIFSVTRSRRKSQMTQLNLATAPKFIHWNDILTEEEINDWSEDSRECCFDKSNALTRSSVNTFERI